MKSSVKDKVDNVLIMNGVFCPIHFFLYFTSDKKITSCVFIYNFFIFFFLTISKVHFPTDYYGDP